MSNLPGFTADASLSKRNTGYRNGCDWVTADPAQVIIAQNFIGDFFRQMGRDLEGVAELLWGAAKCTYSTVNLGKSCAEGVETGDGSECANASQEWVENCFAG